MCLGLPGCRKMEERPITLQVGVKVLLKNKESKFLLLQRNPDTYPDLGAMWDIVGGRINPGVPLLENLRREVKEETNLDLIDEPKLIAAQDILRVPGKHVVRLTYIGTIDGEPTLDEEHVAYKWFTSHQIQALDNLDTYFKELLKYKKPF